MCDLVVVVGCLVVVVICLCVVCSPVACVGCVSLGGCWCCRVLISWWVVLCGYLVGSAVGAVLDTGRVCVCVWLFGGVMRWPQPDPMEGVCVGVIWWRDALASA